MQVGDGESAHDVPYSAQPSLADLSAAVFGFIRRQFLVVLSVALLILGLGAVYLFITPPLYSAQAELMLDTGRIQVVKQSILGDDLNWQMIDSQIEILKSENLALTIIKNLHLTQDPEFIAPPRGPIAIVKNAILNPFIAKPKSEPDLTRLAVQAFEHQLTVSRVGATYGIAIEFQSANPDRAAQIANAVAEGFIADQIEAKYQIIRGATAWLQDRLNDLQGQAAAAERAVVDYKKKNNIVDTGGGRLMNEQEVVEVNTALTQARATTAEAQARLNRVTEVLSGANANTDESINYYSESRSRSRCTASIGCSPSTFATVTDTLQNPIITPLRQQYLDLSQREALFASKYGENHLAVVNLRNRMQEIRRSIVDELNQIAAAYKSDYDIAKAREDSLEKALAATVAGSQTTNKAQIELRQLESAAQTYRALYDNFQQRYTDSVQQQSLPMAEARLITRASSPLGPSSPKSLKILAAASMGGLVLGLGLAMLREISDRVFRTGKQVEARLNTECLAIVPLIKEGAAAPVRNKGAAATASRIIAPTVGVFRNVIDAPLSPFAESIRAVKMSVNVAGAGKSTKVIGITSSHPNEGKSTIAASLAQLTADGGARVILVDCDLRKPSLSRRLVPDGTRGLIDVITNKASIDKVMWYDASTRLSFLPAGVRSPLIHTSEILASDAMKEFFARLRESYEYVIVDLSPITPVVDVRSATHLVDAFLFVIQWGKTKIDVAEHALNTARGVYDNLLGAVLNKVDLKALNRYEGHGNYYYSRHYAHYGYTE
jgi:succinoglycan biosynthesis transport protein ExoP